MSVVFLHILNMSLTAGYVILFVLAARLLMKKAPKIFSYALWGVVLFRLICPFSFKSLFSLLVINTKPIPSDIAYFKIPQINTGIEIIDNAANPILSTQMVTQGVSVNPMQIWITIGNWIWLAGIAVLLIYSLVSLLHLRSNLVGAVKWRDNIYLADHIASPFVIGVIYPKIYLPSSLSAQEQEYIILHEQTHIRRFDHVIKIIAFLVLVLHWFNPLVWLAFVLCVKDMEMSCDESVMKHMNEDIRQEYSVSLLSLATGRRKIAGTPLAFGEGDTKSRIKNVLNYKKPAVWIVAMAVVICIILTVCLIANPHSDDTTSHEAGLIDYDATDPAEVVRAEYMSWLKRDYTISMNVLDAEVDDAETQRHIEEYKGSELAESRGWTDDYLDQHFIVVKVIYECEFDHNKTFMDDGLLEGYVFLTRDPENGVWTIADRTSPSSYDPEHVIEEQKAQIEQYEKVYELRNVLDIETRKLLSALNSGIFGEDEKELLNDSIEIKEDRLEISYEGYSHEIHFFQNKLDFEHVRQRYYLLDEQGRFITGYEVVFSDDTQEFRGGGYIKELVFTFIESPSGWKLAHIGEDA